MSAGSIATVIDCLEFARGGGVLQRSFGLDEMPRLASHLAAAGGCLSVRLEGWRDGEGKSWLRVDIVGEPVLCCQRCLGAVKFPLNIQSRLQLIGPGEDWPDGELQDDDADAIRADKAMDVLALIEDEVLLALPIAPRHERCHAPLANTVEHESSPFAALGALKKH